MRSSLGYRYNPFEMAICGYSGSGKTQLISGLIETLKPQLELGYVKHQAHAFQMDREGKDTAQASVAGATVVGIHDSRHSALIDASPGLRLEGDLRFLRCDAVLIEGGKELLMPKIVVVDAERRILDELPEGAVLLCGAEPLQHDLPWLHRDAIAAIAAWLLRRWRQQITRQPLHGLILAGGLSQRMGEDKALLAYHGRPQIEHLAVLMQPFCQKIWLSRRPEQSELSTALPVLRDRLWEMGPLSGILSAFLEVPQATWLVLACDMPSISQTFLVQLLAARRGHRVASVPETSSGLEPLAAIYEPKFLRLALDGIGRGEYSPKRLLETLPLHRVPVDEAAILQSINEPEARTAWLAAESQLRTSF